MWATLLAALLLSACATNPLPRPDSGPANWGQHREQAGALQDWELRGKLGYRGPDANGSAWLNWLQRDDHFDLTFTGPMGAGATHISGDSSIAVLTRGREESRASTVSTLTREALGINLPLDELLWWVRGLPAPGQSASLQVGDDQLLASLRQAGWQLLFDRYTLVDGLYLPSRISGTGTGAYDGLGFTLVIHQWQIHPAGQLTGHNPSSPGASEP